MNAIYKSFIKITHRDAQIIPNTLRSAVAAGMLAVPLAVAARYDQCPENYSCYYAGPDGNGTPWLAPTAGKHVLPFKVYSLRNRGHGDVYLKNEQTDALEGPFPIGFQGNNDFLEADTVCIVPFTDC